MKPFVVLLVCFLFSLLALKILGKNVNWPLAARISLSIMLFFTAMGHFMFTDGMARMVPDIFPIKREIIYFTGLIEIAAAIGLHIPKFRVLTAWLLIVFFVLLLPANIKAAIERLNYQTRAYDGPGLSYLWFRIPFQLLLIAWTYFGAVKLWRPL